LVNFIANILELFHPLNFQRAASKVHNQASRPPVVYPAKQIEIADCAGSLGENARRVAES
jgi:hypothetical protein